MRRHGALATARAVPAALAGVASTDATGSPRAGRSAADAISGTGAAKGNVCVILRALSRLRELGAEGSAGSMSERAGFHGDSTLYAPVGPVGSFAAQWVGG